MVDSNARLVEPVQGIEGGAAEQAVSFRFTVTWTSVFDALEAPGSAGTSIAPIAVAPISDRACTVITAPADAPLEPPAGPLNERISGDEPVLKGQKKLPPNVSFQWEMVVPKMVRSTPRTTRAREIAAPPSRPRPVLQPRPEPPRSSEVAEDLGARPTTIASSVATEENSPNFCSLTPSFLSRLRQGTLGIKLLLGAAAVTALAVPVWRYFDSPRPTSAEIQTTMQAGGWAREPVTKTDAGFNHARELVVYRPSLKASDCRFDFNWKVDTSAVAWVFRAQDTANYYAMRIKVLKPGPSPTLGVEHFVVYRGAEGAHSEKVLVLSKRDPVLRIRTEIAGPSFTLYIGETAAEYWSDTKLASGGLGFLEEWHQGSSVEGIRMSFAPGTEIQRDGLRLYMNAPSGGD